MISESGEFHAQLIGIKIRSRDFYKTLSLGLMHQPAISLNSIIVFGLDSPCSPWGIPRYVWRLHVAKQMELRWRQGGDIAGPVPVFPLMDVA